MQDRAARTARMPQLAKYELLEELGHGGMATVYRARDRRLGREVAVKVIHPHLRDSREVVSRFNAEAKAVAKLRHPNIVDVYDVSEPDEADQYLVVGLVRGTTLRKLLQERGPMPPEIGAALGSELLAALAHAHANGVVHRDVKPENVLIERGRTSAEVADDATHERDGSRVVVKLTDFGIAKLLDAQGVTSTGQVLGSPAHMAPEQIEGGDVDARSDVFGVGVLLYECIVGHLPFDGNNPAQVLRRVLDGQYPEAQHERPIVGSVWSKVLDRALAHAPDDRFADANAMRDAIAAELHRLEVEAPERDLEAWLDDPDGFDGGYRKKIVASLCALAGDARKRGDVLAAAADYNRALAYAPSDPHLLRIVAGMNRAERRGRLLRRIGGASAVAVGLCALWLGVAPLVRGRVAPPPSAAGPTSSAGASLSLATSASGGPAVSVEPGLVAPPLPTRAVIVHDPFVHVTERKLTLDLKPPMGVSVSIDGQPDRSVSAGDTVTLSTKLHVLGFSCPVCSPVRITVDASERDSRLAVYVPVKPATLVVDGDGARTYQIVEHPEIVVRVGPNTVPLRSAYEPVTVKQIESGDSVSVRLEAAKTMHAAFP